MRINLIKLSRHGFARELEFAVSDQTDSSISFTLTSNDATLKKFPFPFVFDIIYSITNDQLQVTYKVTNTGDEYDVFFRRWSPGF